MKDKPKIGITMGDPAGIGPEIIDKAFTSAEVHQICRPIVIGDSSVLDNAQKAANTNLRMNSIKHLAEALFQPEVIDVYDLQNIELKELKMGQPQAIAGEASYEYVAKAVKLALEGEIDGIATAPISKEALKMAGIKYPGHTEMLAELTGTKDYAMMFVAGSLRVILATIHVSLREACNLIKKESLATTIRLANEMMQKFGVEKARIAVAGLNPHAGEGGLFGHEDIDEIKPAVDSARNNGLNVVGPLPADTLFHRAKNGEFDIVVAMYHDQGCIPIKLLGFDIGVNITAGLPIIRTSVDHGTAYRRAGLMLGTGNPSSLIEAIKLAAKLSRKP